MKTILMVGTFLCSITLSQATTLSFEDLPGTGSVPSNYAGLTWANWVHYDQPLPPFNAGSGQVRLFPQTNTATIQFGQDVTFVGAWLAGHAFDQYFEGYKNGIKLFESSHVANDGSNFGQLFTLNWSGVDEIRFQAPLPDQTAFDDLEYNILESAADGDVAVDVGYSTLYKLKAADGTVRWGPVSRGNCGGLAVDQLDFGVYTAGAANCTGGGTGTVYKYDASGALVWSTGYAGCGVSGNYYVGNGGIAVDTTSGTPGVVLAKSGYYGDLGKVSRTNGSTIFCDGTNDIGRPTIDPSNGQIYDITNLGGPGYNTLYSATATGSLTSASSCEGYTDLNPADGMLYRGGRSCGVTLYQISPALTHWPSSRGAADTSTRRASHLPKSSLSILQRKLWSGCLTQRSVQAAWLSIRMVGTSTSPMAPAILFTPIAQPAPWYGPVPIWVAR
jgi:hypothetical protein